MIVDQIPAIGDLSARDKYILANELWEEIEANEESIPFDDAVVNLLERRHKEYLADPTKVISWEDLKKKISNR